MSNRDVGQSGNFLCQFTLFSGNFSPRTLTIHLKVGFVWILHLGHIYRLLNRRNPMLLFEEESFYIYRVSSSYPTLPLLR